MFHNRKTRKRYLKYPKPTLCQFCDPVAIQDTLVRETTHAYVLKNRTFYDTWEMAGVVDHLLVIPKRHVATISDLSNAAKLDIMNIIGDYEKTDYNAYARAARNKRRSVTHQHTHLIRTDHKQARFFLHLRRPYFLIRF
jgi:diadenosine tetraphosphate (Ap4A) HIT family hydrolase